MKQGRIYLAGGGTAEQELPILKSFLDSITSPDILYIPLALDPFGNYFKNAETWIHQTLGSVYPNKPLNIQTVKNTSQIPKGDFGAIFIGGGSAGAIICGQWIDLSQSEPMGECDFHGMNLLAGLSCACHYQETHLPRIETHFKKRASPIICLTETAGALIEDAQITSCGLSPLWVHTKSGHRRLDAGTSLTSLTT